jgi:predicted HicB family RNase H-like nuclease
VPNIAQPMTFRVPPAVRKRLEALAKRKRWSLNTAAVVVLEGGLTLPENQP